MSSGLGELKANGVELSAKASFKYWWIFGDRSFNTGLAGTLEMLVRILPNIDGCDSLTAPAL